MYIYLTSLLYKPNFGGVENSIYCLASEYQKQGYKVKILCTDLPKTLSLSQKEFINNIEVIRYPWIRLFQNIFILNYIINIIGLIFFYKRNILSRKSLVISRHHITSIALICGGYKNICYIVPEVIMKSNYEKLNFKQKIVMKFNFQIQRVVIKKLNKIYIFSNNVAKQFFKLGVKANFIKLKPGIDTTKFKFLNNKKNLRIKYQLPTDKYIFLCMGRLIKTKSFDLCIKSFSTLKENCLLLIVGEGVELQNLKEIVKTHNLEDKVLFFKQTHSPEDFYNLSDIFMMTSINEAFGQVIIESLSCNLPIIYFENGIYNDIEIENAIDEIIGLSNCALSSRFGVKELSEIMEKSFTYEFDSFPCLESYNWNKMSLDIIKC